MTKPTTEQDLSGKVAIITGASAGYGLGTAKALVEAGVRVYGTGRNRDRLEKACAETGAIPFVADVCSSGDWQRLLDTVLQDTGRIDILVNNAGAGGRIGAFDALSPEEIHGILETNLTGPILGCRAVLPAMVKAGSGTIINVSSLCSRYSWPGWAVYSVAKAGLERLTKSLYAEYRERGIRVNSLIPSWGATEFLDASNIAGHPVSEPEIRAKCTQPEEFGEAVRHICATPAHLNVLEYSLLPTVQAIEPL